MQIKKKISKNGQSDIYNRAEYTNHLSNKSYRLCENETEEEASSQQRAVEPLMDE
jgi:hypothetical protein